MGRFGVRYGIGYGAVRHEILAAFFVLPGVPGGGCDGKMRYAVRFTVRCRAVRHTVVS